MFKKIKDYFTQKKAIRLYMLDTFMKVNEVVTIVNESVKKYSDNLSEVLDGNGLEQLSKLSEDIGKLVNNTDLKTEYFKQVNKNAHEEKMAEINKNK